MQRGALLLRYRNRDAAPWRRNCHLSRSGVGNDEIHATDLSPPVALDIRRYSPFLRSPKRAMIEVSGVFGLIFVS
jgi:hypothetical protein